jgi:pyruvate ferredoxin oxidoreductase delta subunit
MQKQQEKPMRQQKKFRVLGPVASVFQSTKTGSWRLEKPEVEFKQCIKCGTCERYCPANVITIHKDKEECVEFMWDYCKGCGICANVCPTKCISMIEERGEK